ncbi:hypothetical protein [Ulvibacterium sp.]|uniref:hypothetical protein n=1 Tax=Ulvibacterium sp. TaxID=2665914 RepID=UPI003BAD7A13
MIKTSILRAKIERSKIDFRDTFLWNEEQADANKNLILNLLLKNGEEIILHYIKSEEYRWFLTNERIIFPHETSHIFLSHLIDVGIPQELVENPDEKMTNNKLILSTKENDAHELYVEEKTWHLFYNVFKFIVSKNRDKITTGNGSD